MPDMMELDLNQAGVDEPRHPPVSLNSRKGTRYLNPKTRLRGRLASMMQMPTDVFSEVEQYHNVRKISSSSDRSHFTFRLTISFACRGRIRGCANY